MITRYEDEKIRNLWSNRNKLKLWLRTEMAVMQAMVKLGKMPEIIFKQIKKKFSSNAINLKWWLARDNEIKHDLNAFIDERKRYLNAEEQQYFHKKITSYDTEESAFVTTLYMSCQLVLKKIEATEEALIALARIHRYTIMNGRTHGQEAEIQTFGKRCLTWLADLRLSKENLLRTLPILRFSKISGAIGNYGSIDPQLEKLALSEMKLIPYYGSTQIMPREMYAPIAQALYQVVMTLNKIALSIRLGSRSGRPIFQEPFAKKQKGSSAMPHKKNTILTEQIEGMARMAQGYALMIQQNISTWEERAIEQSSVERVAWPDLFHVTIRSLTVMKNILSGLQVFNENMMAEIIESRGCYASSEAKELLKELGQPFDLDYESAYRIVQLAAFNAFETNWVKQTYRGAFANSSSHAMEIFKFYKTTKPARVVSIQEIIRKGNLKVSKQLEADDHQVDQWNAMLRAVFAKKKNIKRWNEIFDPDFLLQNEDFLYQTILKE